MKGFSEEQKQIQDLSRKFTEEEIIPVAAELDRTGEVGAFHAGRIKSTWSVQRP